jgi:hypothetical protein
VISLISLLLSMCVPIELLHLFIPWVLTTATCVLNSN